LLLPVALMGALYYRAARQEEEAFLNSPFAPHYREYRRGTGMFLPPPSARASHAAGRSLRVGGAAVACFSPPPPRLVRPALALPACSLPAQHEPPGEVVGAPGVVYVLDGSGGLRKIAPKLTKALAAAHSPLRVEEVPWGHGSGRVFADLWGR